MKKLTILNILKVIVGPEFSWYIFPSRNNTRCGNMSSVFASKTWTIIGLVAFHVEFVPYKVKEKGKAWSITSDFLKTKRILKQRFFPNAQLARSKVFKYIGVIEKLFLFFTCSSCILIEVERSTNSTGTNFVEAHWFSKAIRKIISISVLLGL